MFLKQHSVCLKFLLTWCLVLNRVIVLNTYDILAFILNASVLNLELF